MEKEVETEKKVKLPVLREVLRLCHLPTGVTDNSMEPHLAFWVHLLWSSFLI